MEKKKISVTALQNRLGKLAKKYNCKYWSVQIAITSGVHSTGTKFVNKNAFSLFVHGSMETITPSFSSCQMADVELAFHDIEVQLKCYFEKKEYSQIEVELIN
jgi:hypothetical protein